MATTNTVTRLTVLAHVLADADFLTPNEREVLEKMVASLSKPRKATGEPTKAQLENQNLAAALVNAMRAHGEPVTAKWICDHLEGVNSPQKAVAVAKAASNSVVRFYEGRQAYYRLNG